MRKVSRQCLTALDRCLHSATGLQRLALQALDPVDDHLMANDAPALFVVDGGIAHIQRAGGHTVLQPDRPILIPPRTGYLLCGAHTAAQVYSVMPHRGQLVCNALDAHGPDLIARLGSLLIADTGSPGLVASLLNAMAQWPASDSEGWNLCLQATFRAIRQSVQGESRYVGGGTSILARVQELLLEQYSNPDCGLRFLARQLQCHPDHLAKSFRERQGHTIRDALVQLRVQKARQLLLDERSVAIAEVARRSGFRNGQRLSEHFRQIYGLTPSQLRRQAHTYID